MNRPLPDGDLQSLVYLTPLGLPKRMSEAEREQTMAAFVLRALDFAPNGLSEESLDHLYELACEIGVKQTLMRTILDGELEAFRRHEDGAVRYRSRDDPPASASS